MQGVRNLFIPICFSLVVSVGYGRCKTLASPAAKEEAEDFFHSAEEDLTVEEDENAQERQGNFSEGTKEEFFHKLNLTGVTQEHSRIDPPQFMIELYNRYASNKSSMPRSDVIRSFLLQDITHSERNDDMSKHRLLFNVSIPSHEEITTAELRLFTLLEERSAVRAAARATIKVYAVEHGGAGLNLRFLSSGDAEGSCHSWEAFNITDAVQGWLRSGGGANELEVHVERRGCREIHGGGLDISLSLKGNSSAALVVFSDDLGSRKKESENELRDMMAHEEEGMFSEMDIQAGNRHNGEIPPEVLAGIQPDVHLRERRQVRRDYCRRTSLRVNFKDIGWDKWIVAPMEYEAFECKGLCYFPLTDDLTPSKHAVIQTLVNLRNPKKANMACCVPTKLDPITVLYQEKDIITVRQMYEEMQVAACGCR
ncbi:growth/differentiation factor 2 [Conger conger]|uniref:growth/differentiation factor 2 n=1 Tax=Conger conger TaxID=82655 RepID=UPI002A59B376|nr:growth/differentiation factor 2 [Conger conger]